MVRIALVEDHVMFREGLRTCLDLIPGFKVVCEASCGAEFEKMYNPDEIDVTLMDLRLKGQHGSITCHNIHKQYPRARIIILSMYDDPEIILTMIRYGAAAYVTKDADLGRIEKVIREVMENGHYFDWNLGDMMLAEMMKAHKKKLIDDEFRVEFTETELRVAYLACAQYTNDEIAVELGITRRSVEHHKANLQLKTDSRNFFGVITYLYKHYLLLPQQF
ncbi:MAG: response regulator transcription factor [Bacteroidetes bacterium]|nr:response regulator transcription factor [Bacteroidota bacterium]